MSRFIKYASNLLDGVDSIAKESLTDQDIAAAAAAERRRRRRQLKRDSSSGIRGGASAGAEPSDGDLSADSSQLDTPGPRGQHRVRSSVGGLRNSGSSGFDGGGSPTEAERGRLIEGASPAVALHAPPPAASVAKPVGLKSEAFTAGAITTPDPMSGDLDASAAPGGVPGVGYASSGGDNEGAGLNQAAKVAASAPLTAPPQQQQDHSNPRQQHGYLGATPTFMSGGAGAGSAPGKEDGSVWSDKDTISSAAPSPQGREPLHYVGHGDNDDGGGGGGGGRHVEFSATTPVQRRPPRLESSLIGGTADVVVGDTGEDQDEEDEEEVEDRRARAASIMASNVSMHVNVDHSPPTTPLGRERHLQQQPEDEEEYRSHGATGVGAPAGGGGFTRSAPSPPSGVTSSVAASVSLSGGSASGRESRGLSSLLGMGGRKGRRDNNGRNDDDVEGLRAEAEDLRVEVEELSLELEDAEERLRGQEAELKTSAEKLKRQKATAAEKERAMEAEMEDFRTLQVEEKKVFLANLEGMEQKLKDKEREVDEARSALSALEAFAMEREDAATKLAHEKDELLEELRGARSGQDRSAEEMREALSRADAEAEEVEARHRAWTRQAQARQTELEATAAQLTEALAEADRKKHQSDAAAAAAASASEGGEEARRDGTQAGGGTRTKSREMRALGDKLESCQASLELEQERARSLEQEAAALRHDLDVSRAAEAVADRQRQEHAKIAADSFAKVTRLEQQLQHEKANATRLGAPALTPAGPESQIQSLSSKLLDKQARLEESMRERTTLSAKLKEANDRAFRAEQELRESRGETLEAGGIGAAGLGGGGGSMMRPRRGRQDRSARGGVAWSRLGPIAKHRKIATAVDVLDRQALQGVVFLRNSSMARAVFLAYLLVLHLWAFVIVSFHSSQLDHMKHSRGFTGDDHIGHG